MTGGRVVVLGRTGRNFAAGMSGGIAYVLDWQGTFQERCNLESIELSGLDDLDEISQVKGMIQTHGELTGSLLAYRILAEWDEVLKRFVRVMPKDYKRMLQAFREMEEAGLSGEEAVMAAFNRNSRDLVRISGN
jgi:glutamate synthase (NADPH) large chain